jgi:phosphatidylglycerol---prolipoprotein diacylglyceryl transferase
MSIYGVLIGIAIIIGIELIRKYKKNITYSSIIFVLAITLLGSRTLFLLHNISGNKQGVVNPFTIWQGGLTFYGGLIGLLIAIYILSKFKKENFFNISDPIFLFLPLIHSIGRIGNYFNHELYGKPTNLPLAIEIPLEFRVKEYIDYTHFHPVFLYESVLNILNFLILLSLSKKTNKKGLTTSIYLINYSIIRILTNTLRIDKVYLFGIESSDIFSVFFLLTGILILSIIMNKKNFLAKIFSRAFMISLVIFTSLSILFKTTIPLYIQILLILFTFIIPLLCAILFNLFDLTSDLSISRREERPKLFLLFLVSFLISLSISIKAQQPLLVETYLILNFTFLLGFLITFFWKISFHMIMATLIIFFTIHVWQTPYIYLLIFTLPLIGWSRLQLRRHSLKQVLGGFFLSIACILLVLTFFNF